VSPRYSKVRDTAGEPRDVARYQLYLRTAKQEHAAHHCEFAFFRRVQHERVPLDDLEPREVHAPDIEQQLGNVPPACLGSLVQTAAAVRVRVEQQAPEQRLPEERWPEGLVARTKVCVLDAHESGEFMEEVEVRTRLGGRPP
jgi:hypothetical protein